MTTDDLRSFSAEWVEPISIDYRGWKIYELPPNGQGMAALEMLNIMETSPATPDGPCAPAEMHKRIEAMKLAYSDVYRYCGDPRTCEVPITQLLSKEHARKRAALIDPARANGEVSACEVTGSDTTYLAVVDREGNIASWIQSIYNHFGSGITVDGMGFVLQNRGAGFTLDPRHPNVLAGGKRPFHTIIPGFMERGARHIGFGIMGGPNQPLAHAQFVSNFVDYGMNLQQALESPRFTKSAPSGCDVLIESRVPPETLAEVGEHWATRFTCAVNTRRKWAAAKRCCTIRRQASITQPPTRGATEPRHPSRCRLEYRTFAIRIVRDHGRGMAPSPETERPLEH